jgi:hypothetical protein
LPLLLACLALLPALAQAAAARTLSGQVSNAATRAYLEGATVTLEGTSRTVVTDREGRYMLGDLGGSQAVLVVSFTGLDSQRLVVPFSGPHTVRDVALTAEVYQLEKFTVAGEREGTAKAETLQRQAPNVKAIVSSDTFGNVADGNVGDLLQRVVGLTADYNGMDVRQVSIRGVSSALNSVTMDGQHLATSQSAGTGRQFEFEQASLGNIETIEVTKAPTPDMDGASIGGSVNLVTKSAFAAPAGMDGQDLLPALRGRAARGFTSLLRDTVITGRELHARNAREGDRPYPMRALRDRHFLYIRNFKPDRWPVFPRRSPPPRSATWTAAPRAPTTPRAPETRVSHRSWNSPSASAPPRSSAIWPPIRIRCATSPPIRGTPRHASACPPICCARCARPATRASSATTTASTARPTTVSLRSKRNENPDPRSAAPSVPAPFSLLHSLRR